MKYLLVLALILMAVSLPALPKVAYIGMSAALPGSGELALGKVNRAGFFLGMDLLAFTTYWALGQQRDDLHESYKLYAQAYAGVPVTNDEHYYSHVRKYLSSDDFNLYQEMMARNYYLIYNYDLDAYNTYMADNTYSESEAWHWQSEYHLDQFRKLRSKYMKMRLYQNASLGAVFLNRLISAVDVVFITRKPSGTTALYFTPSRDDGLMLNYQLEF
ncbi:MAG TPA: hypothetical protein PLQ79_07125 [Candidatus Cloacimonadota bacterium]|nr:hypothetical protein [Candidatus Cloacimonadota bacterium]HQL12715.1 hypothetical protein [Candidatus Cloacimonadota bacterium]HQO44638.1 hypothetical protein [Candidatus Cloacimonadota bacterium]HQP18322.1 hypothetical protein [Candidatus Cloacimonadota bacterium]